MFQICHAKTYSILPFSFKDKEHQLKIMMKNVSAVLTIINSPSVTVLCPRIWGCLGPKPSDLKKLLQSVTVFPSNCRSSHPDVFFLKKDVLKICSKFTGEHPCRYVISIKLLCYFIEITLQYRCSPVYLLHIFRTPFIKNTFGGLLLNKTNFAL